MNKAIIPKKGTEGVGRSATTAVIVGFSDGFYSRFDSSFKLQIYRIDLIHGNLIKSIK